jgi:hypothetical protein
MYEAHKMIAHINEMKAHSYKARFDDFAPKESEKIASRALAHSERNELRIASARFLCQMMSKFGIAISPC